MSVDQRAIARGQQTAVRFNFSHWTDLRPLSDALPSRAEPRRCGVGFAERCVAFLFLLISSPLFALIAIAIKIESPGGPVFYLQERVGLDRRKSKADRLRSLPDRRTGRGIGQIFRICKFRTMIPDAESKTGPVWAMDHDHRVTRVGRVLRHLRLDELPQLMNVASGDMRLIGPRPERPHFVMQLCEEIPEYALRQVVPPGITGLAQVERDYDGSVDDVRTKVKYDLFYVHNRSLILDLKITLMTLDVMLRGRGAR